VVFVVLTLPVVELVVVLTLPVVELVELVVLTLPVVELVALVVLTLVEFEVELVTLAAKEVGALGTWHWHLLVGSTLTELTLLQSVHVQVVVLEVWLAPTVTLQTQF
jgi:hypothetical protein